MSDQVLPVPINAALKITLNNYYDLLKSNVGGLQASEFLQLKLVADPVDISSKDYPFFSYANLRVKSDVAIVPKPVAAEGVSTGATTLVSIYGSFLRELRDLVIPGILTPEESLRVTALDQIMKGQRDLIDQYEKADMAKWKDYATLFGLDPKDFAAYTQWAAAHASLAEIQTARKEITAAYNEQSKLQGR